MYYLVENLLPSLDLKHSNLGEEETNYDVNLTPLNVSDTVVLSSEKKTSERRIRQDGLDLKWTFPESERQISEPRTESVKIRTNSQVNQNLRRDK